LKDSLPLPTQNIQHPQQDQVQCGQLLMEQISSVVVTFPPQWLFDEEASE
jgi:hypothetical protein